MNSEKIFQERQERIKMNSTTVWITKQDGGNGKNATGIVAEALQKLIASGGGTLRFEKGEYHFFEEHTVRRFFAVSNNSACEKKIAMLVDHADGLTIDGGGSVFVFHELVFPIVITHSKRVTVQNIVFDRGCDPVVHMQLHDIGEGGFSLAIDAQRYPYHIERGALVFEREWGNASGLDRVFALHASPRFHIEYLVTGDCRLPVDNLAANYVWVDAEEADGGVYCRYRKDRAYSHRFQEGEAVFSLVDGRRDIDLIFAEHSDTLRIADITVRCAVGMGVIAQCSRNIEIDGFCTEPSEDGERTTLTADAMHFVHCSGKLEIHRCHIVDTADDAINVHGMYTEVERAEEHALYVRICHQEQRHFMPYKASDRIVLIHPETLEEVAEWMVERAEWTDSDGARIQIHGRRIRGDQPIEPGFLVELPDKMPQVHVYDNEFDRYPNLRLSGSGTIVVENNRFSNATSALLALDLAKYWYESGRIRHLIFRNNDLDNCNGKAGRRFIHIGVSGKESSDCPKIHQTIEIYGNQFRNVKQYAIDASGVQSLTIHDNVFDFAPESCVLVDGQAADGNEWASSR